MAIVRTGIVVAAVIVARGAFAQTVHPWGTNPCPPPGDTLSLLQPGDSAYADAPAFARFLEDHHFAVRCVTRTKFEGFLGVRKAAGFQTDKGPIWVLFFEGAERVRVHEHKTSKGYRYRFQNAPYPGVGDVQNVNGPMHFVAHGRWFIIAPDEQVAAALRRAVDEASVPGKVNP